MNKSKKKKVKNNQQSTSAYLIWEQYKEFIRRLYLEKPIKRPTGKQLTLRFLSKLGIVFFGAFFTTLTFYFLIDPNGLYNSGLNGLLQAVSKLLIGHGKVSWENYYFFYYGLGLLANLLFIFFLRAFFKAKLGIISTSIFYVLSQIIWTQIFDFFKLKEYVFSRFNPASWQGLSTNSQLSFTLPYYIVIAIVAAIIHTYGYSLIFQAQATPGGLEILTSHFSQQKKKKFSIGTLTRFFGIIIIFAVTLINFIWIEDESGMKKNILQKGILEQEEKKENKSSAKQGQITKVKRGRLKEVLNEWKKDMNEAKKLEKEGKIKESFEIRNNEKNHLLTLFLKNKIGEPELEKYPEEVDYYLANENEKIAKIKKEIYEINDQIQTKTNILSKDELQERLKRKNNLEERVNKLKKEHDRSSLEKYLSYISNNERLWATIVYIFLSAFLISQIFPRDQIVLLRLHSLTEENRNKGLKLLEKYSPTYYNIYHKKRGREETIFVISCHLSKWNYYLLTPYLKQLGTTYINETQQ